VSVASGVAETTFAAARRAGRTVDVLLERPRAVLGALIGLQIAATAVLAASIAHNGWVYFQGGDQIGIASQAWLLGRLDLPPTELGYLWSLVLTPVMWITGPTYVQALPFVMLLNVFVLGPIALLLVYAIAAHIGGRLLGYWASFLWVVAPFASIPLWVDRYQERWTEHFLPQALGLGPLSDFPSMVVVLACAYFVVRSLEPGRVADAALAGLLAGAAGGMKPPNLLIGAGAAFAYLVARRWREGFVFGAAVVPSLLVLAYWKEKGLGQIPGVSLEVMALAAGAGTLAIEISLEDYIELDVDHWRVQMDQLREFFWSARVAQWAPFAGLLAVLRVRRAPAAALLAGWLAAFLLVKGFSERADIQANTFWRLLMPAWPAYLLLFASIPLLVPTLARRLGDRLDAPAMRRPLRLRWVGVAAVLVVLVPAAVTLAATPVDDPARAVYQDDEGNTILTAVDRDIDVRVERVSDGVRVSWEDDESWRADVFYRVYRHDAAGADTLCTTAFNVSIFCFLRGVTLGTTREPEFLDPAPPAGATYRIGVGTNWLDDPEAGDVFTFSPQSSSVPG
jgi:hypothetical protein